MPTPPPARGGRYLACGGAMIQSSHVVQNYQLYTVGHYLYYMGPNRGFCPNAQFCSLNIHVEPGL